MKRTLLLLALLLAIPLRAATTIPLPPENERWTQLQMGNFIVYSNARDGVMRDAAENVARLRLALGRISHLVTDAPIPTYFYVFKSEESFAPYRDTVAGPRKEMVKGFFTTDRRANYATITANTGLVDHLVAHELTHHFIHNTVVGVPAWFDEGLAEFYSWSTYAQGSIRVGVPFQPYIDELSNHGLMPLRELAATHPLRHDVDDVRAIRFYAESWFFVHYLLIGNPQRGAQLGELLSRLYEGASLDAAFKAAFHATPEEIDTELGAYLHRPRFNAILYTQRDLGEITVPTPAPISRAAALTALGDLLLHIDARQSPAFLSEAVKLEPKNALAVALLAIAKLANGAYAEGTALYDSVAALDWPDSRPYALASGHRVSELQERARNGEAVSADEIAEVRRVATLALSKSANDVDAMSTMGASYTFAGQDANAGVQWSSKAFSLAPSRIDIACDLVLLHARAGEQAMAKDLINHTIRPAHIDRYDNEAAQNLVLAKFYAADAMRAAGSEDDARKLYETVRASTNNPKLRAVVDKRLEKP